MEKEVVYLGIDPGMTGFVACYRKGEFTFYDMPTHKAPNGKVNKNGSLSMSTVYNPSGYPDLYKQIADDLKDCEVVCYFERIIAQRAWGVKGNMNFGKNIGYQMIIPYFLNAEIVEVLPKAWQKTVRKGYTMITIRVKGKVKNDNKAIAAMIATTEFPDIDFKSKPTNKVLHDGKVDAFLILLHGLRERGIKI